MFLPKLLSISATLAMTAGSALLVATPAIGQSRQLVVTAPRDEVLPTRHVSHADLNLATKRDEVRLDRRVRVAVRDVCRESVGLMPPRFLEQECKSVAWDGARPQVAQAVQRAREIAASGTSSIAAASITISLDQ